MSHAFPSELEAEFESLEWVALAPPSEVWMPQAIAEQMKLIPTVLAVFIIALSFDHTFGGRSPLRTSNKLNYRGCGLWLDGMAGGAFASADMSDPRFHIGDRH